MGRAGSMANRTGDKAPVERLTTRRVFERDAESFTDVSLAAGAESLVIDLRQDLEVDLRPRIYLRGDEGILGAPRWKLAIKRLVDIATAIFFIVLFAPVMILTALAIKLTSRGPVLYVQERCGKYGKVFKFAKFRSMYDGAHEDLPHLQGKNEVTGPVFKIREDPRITAVGRFIRKYSIDELPQFFHVLTGQMSLVGPRPPIPEEVACYDAWEDQRLLTKPGITCIWQVSGRSDLDFETWVKMDVEYIASWSPWLDFVILLKTIPAVISGKGAY